MEEDKIERAIQFLLDNQAGHDARLGRLEETVKQLGERIDKLSDTVGKLSEDLYGGLEQMREGMGKLTGIAEQTMLMVQQVTHNQVAANRRITDTEGRLDKVEDTLNM